MMGSAEGTVAVPAATAPVRPRRQYDSSLRRQRAAETRERIIAAGSTLLRGSSVRDWQGLTIRAVAEQAGVNERTVYRHFANEQGLHDAVMHRLEDEAGIELHGMQLEDLAGVTARIFDHVATFPPDRATTAGSDAPGGETAPARGSPRCRRRTDRVVARGRPHRGGRNLRHPLERRRLRAPRRRLGDRAG